MRPLVVLGAGGHAREVLDIVEALNRVQPTHEVLGVLAEEADLPPLERRGTPWLGGLERLAELDADCAVGVGLPWTRRSVVAQVAPQARRFLTLMHPSVETGADVEVGEGSVVAAGCHLTTNVRIGRHTHVNVAAVVSHDTVLGDFVTVSPGALLNGDVTVEDDVFVGSGAIVNPRVRLGRGARIGSGAVVVKDVPPGATAFGVPARWE